MTLLSIVVVVKHKNFVVQAGVIPQGEGILKQPSSVIAPGDRYVHSSLQGSRQSATASVESAVLESEAPIGVPMDVLNQSAPTAVSNTQSEPPQVSTSQPEVSTLPPLSPLTPLPHTSLTGKSADIMKAAETSLAKAQDSLHAMRMKQADMLKQEAAQLEARAEELHQEAQELLDEAGALEFGQNPQAGTSEQSNQPAQGEKEDQEKSGN